MLNCNFFTSGFFFFNCQQLAALLLHWLVCVSTSPKISDFLTCFRFAVFVSVLFWPGSTQQCPRLLSSGVSDYFCFFFYPFSLFLWHVPPFPHCISIFPLPRQLAFISSPVMRWLSLLLWFINHLTPNDNYSGRTSPLTSKCCIIYIYSTNTDTEYFKHGIYSPFFPLQNAVCFIILTYLVPILFTFYIQSVLKLKK